MIQLLKSIIQYKKINLRLNTHYLVLLTSLFSPDCLPLCPRSSESNKESWHYINIDLCSLWQTKWYPEKTSAPRPKVAVDNLFQGVTYGLSFNFLHIIFSLVIFLAEHCAGENPWMCVLCHKHSLRHQRFMALGISGHVLNK